MIGTQMTKKEKRQKIYRIYDGRCAYCGERIKYKDMQVDHIIPKRNGGTDSSNNLRPSCRLCNHYKRALDVETFRNWALGKLHERLKKIYIVRVALRYGILTLHKFDNKFFFEK